MPVQNPAPFKIQMFQLTIDKDAYQPKIPCTVPLQRISFIPIMTCSIIAWTTNRCRLHATLPASCSVFIDLRDLWILLLRGRKT